MDKCSKRDQFAYYSRRRREYYKRNEEVKDNNGKDIPPSAFEGQLFRSKAFMSVVKLHTTDQIKNMLEKGELQNTILKQYKALEAFDKKENEKGLEEQNKEMGQGQGQAGTGKIQQKGMQ